jgi:hypothetical protein
VGRVCGVLTTAKNRSRGLNRETSRERRESTEKELLVRGEEFIAPRHRRIHRLLTFGKIAPPAARQQHVLCEFLEEALGRQYFEPGSSQLERERQAIEPPANLRDDGAVPEREPEVRSHPANTLQKEPDCGNKRENGRRHRTRGRFERKRTDGILAFPANTEWSAAGDQHAERRDRSQQIGDQGCRVQDLLEVIKNPQRGLIAARDACAP